MHIFSDAMCPGQLDILTISERLVLLITLKAKNMSLMPMGNHSRATAHYRFSMHLAPRGKPTRRVTFPETVITSAVATLRFCSKHSTCRNSGFSNLAAVC